MIPHPLNPFGFENEQKFLTLTAVNSGTITLNAVGTPKTNNLYYRLGTSGNWNTYVVGTTINLASGASVQFWNSDTALSLSSSDYVQFVFSGQVKASGNCASMLNFPSQTAYRGLTNLFRDCTGLLTAPKLPTLRLGGYCYTGMFRGCTALVKAPELPATDIAAYCYNGMFQDCSSLTQTQKILPATSLKTFCYASMFNGCSSLITAPYLPATTLQSNCYNSMFHSCISLVNPPAALPATTLATFCYNSMFNGCSSLTSIPQLPATDLYSNCYRQMFYNCDELNLININFTNWRNDIDSTLNWVNGIASQGTFIKPSALSEQYGVSRIPTGWTVVNK